MALFRMCRDSILAKVQELSDPRHIPYNVWYVYTGAIGGASTSEASNLKKGDLVHRFSSSYNDEHSVLFMTRDGQRGRYLRAFQLSTDLELWNGE